MTKSTPDIPILDDDAVAEIEAQNRIFMNPNIDALCNTVRALKAENERLLKLYNSAWLWVQRRVKHPNSGMPPAAMTLMEMLPLLPDSMRSACVEKVKSKRAEWLDLANHQTGWCQHVRAADSIIEALESISIQEQEQEQ